MAAEVHFILGRAGSGKSRALRRRIRALLEAGAPVRCIVPEQFTYETERQLAEEGIAGAPVYSFTTLARQALEEQGERGVFLSPQGKGMVVRKIAEEAGEGLCAFGRVAQTTGFAQTCAQLFTRFKRQDITPQALEEAALALPEEDLLGEKLRDISRLYKDTEDFLKGRYLDEEDGFNAFCAALPASSFRGQHIILDGIEFHGEQTWRALGILMDIAASLHIALRLDPYPSRDGELFAGERRALERLESMAAERGCPLYTQALPQDSPRQQKPQLLHLEREAFANPFEPYAGPEDGSIQLFAALHKEGEAQAAAEALLEAARGGMRYRDMAVIAADLSYIGPLQRALQARNIPFFSDGRHKLSDYGAARLLEGALRCVSRGFTQNDVLDLVKTGFCGPREAGEIFENYILARGLRGPGLARPFQGQDVPEGAEETRRRLMEPLLALREALAGAPTAAGKTEALFAYMEELDLYGQLQARTKALELAGELAAMEENSQVYADILTVLDQLHAILGDTRLSTRRYLAILQEGLDAYEIGAIPATADQVLLGSLDRTRARDIRALFILGANAGSFPPEGADDGIIDDGELERMEALGLRRWENSREMAEAARMDIYSALTKPRELLYISYSMGAGAESALPAPMVDRIRAIFPGLPLGNQLSPPPPGSLAGGLDALARELRAFGDTGEPGPELSALYGCFLSQPAYGPLLQGLEEALFPALSPEPFGYGLALRLYGEAPGGGATRLETFNQCPFKHFLQYGLKAQPRKEYKERKPDEGAFCHEALDAFLQAAAREGLAGLDMEGVDRLLDAILPPLLAAHNGGVLLDTARGRAKAARLVRAVRATAWALVRQAQLGDFQPGASEIRFGKGCPYPPLALILPDGSSFLLSGRIDRVDRARVEGQDYYRVVDYKSGSAAFDYTQLYHGLRLQLPLYVAAMAAVESLAEPAGMYYMPIADPAPSEDDTPLEERMQEAFRLRGLTLEEPALVAASAGRDPDNKLIPTGKNAAGLVSREELKEVVGFAKDKARATLAAMLEGRAELSPARQGGALSCKGCAFGGVCGFDPELGCRARNLKRMNKAAFFQALDPKEEENELDG